MVDLVMLRLYVTGAVPPKFYGLPNTQIWHPLRPIVSTRGAITHGVAKESTNILWPLEGHSPTTSETSDTVEHTRPIQLH